jgi:hypothetical protein
VLTLFYRGLSRISGAGSRPDQIGVRGVLTKDTVATVQMAGGTTYERVRIVGFTKVETCKGHLPFELNGMVILEDQQGQRYLVRAKNIQLITIGPDAGAS